jgi:histidinol-phosphate/aromatic aminotransferase/cobyric acid decarboxylase-like protein
VRRFLNAAEDREIIFTRGATEAINLVAASYGDRFLQPGDEVILSALEHHSNIVPWQLLRERRGIVLKVVPVDDSGRLPARRLSQSCSGPRTRLVAVAHIANSIGTVLPLPEIVAAAHRARLPWCWSTAARRCRTRRSTCGRWAPISTPSPATSSMARPASASSTAAPIFSSRCRPGRAAAT